MQRGRKLFIKVSVALAGLAGGLALMSILLEIQGAFMNGDIYAENGAAFANSPWGWVTVGTIIVGMVIGFPVGIGFWGFVATRMKWLTRAEIDKVLDKDRRRMGRK